ncbi:unnamed protein product [Zymoseptoria tritici ST99CH_3D1]|nr:unnamed protein product [Zymoseptoria tritici ST99CH_3D1]
MCFRGDPVQTHKNRFPFEINNRFSPPPNKIWSIPLYNNIDQDHASNHIRTEATKTFEAIRSIINMSYINMSTDVPAAGDAVWTTVAALVDDSEQLKAVKKENDLLKAEIEQYKRERVRVEQIMGEYNRLVALYDELKGVKAANEQLYEVIEQLEAVMKQRNAALMQSVLA